MPSFEGALPPRLNLQLSMRAGCHGRANQKGTTVALTAARSRRTKRPAPRGTVSLLAAPRLNIRTRHSVVMGPPVVAIALALLVHHAAAISVPTLAARGEDGAAVVTAPLSSWSEGEAVFFAPQVS